eukprot:TRINITY_DN2034_c0_g1_i1.p2 TRINITY_DN2034_c0_g1~~TRINITY_DN2034_c0_g1_i1.p2  ORF type:complete len:400 (+),score=27.25 TRINITY_DN2034_c0_g1_i1:67-1266(+)
MLQYNWPHDFQIDSHAQFTIEETNSQPQLLKISSSQLELASEESCYDANSNSDTQHFRLIKGGAMQIQPELNSEGQTYSQEQQDQCKNKKEERNYLTYTHKPTTNFASPRRPRLNLNIDINSDFAPALPYSDIIGKGGFANVYKTTYKGFSVAVKRFHLRYQVEPHSDAFEKELSIMVQLDHKHLVKCYGACKIPNNRVIVMEFFGKSLYQRIQNFKKYSNKQGNTNSRMGLVAILKIVKCIASGLQYLHAKKIVHRDLHPQNVLIDDTGNVKITDVGISKVLRHTVSRDSHRGGCSSYLAPEIFDNKVCRRSDIYSVGIIAWQLWSLQEPWKDVGFGLVCTRVMNGERPLIPHDTPQDLKDIITTCWQQDYKQRPSALQLVQQCNEKLTPLLEQRRKN